MGTQYLKRNKKKDFLLDLVVSRFPDGDEDIIEFCEINGKLIFA